MEKWCQDQREFTAQTSATAAAVNQPQVGYRKPKNNAGKPTTTRDNKLLKRITHPFTKTDKRRLNEAIGQITTNLTSATLTDVQHSDFVQGRADTVA